MGTNPFCTLSSSATQHCYPAPSCSSTVFHNSSAFEICKKSATCHFESHTYGITTNIPKPTRGHMRRLSLQHQQKKPPMSAERTPRRNVCCPKGAAIVTLLKPNLHTVQRNKSSAASYLLSLKTVRTWKRWTTAWWAISQSLSRCYQQHLLCPQVKLCRLQHPSHQECPSLHAVQYHFHRRTGPSSEPASAVPLSPAAGYPQWWARTIHPASTMPADAHGPWPSASLQNQNAPVTKATKLQEEMRSLPPNLKTPWHWYYSSVDNIMMQAAEKDSLHLSTMRMANWSFLYCSSAVLANQPSTEKAAGLLLLLWTWEGIS